MEIESDRSNTNETIKSNDKLMFDKSKQNFDVVRLMNGDLLKRKKKKYKKRRLIEDSIPGDYLSKPKKKALTVKLLLEEKRITESNELFI